jgi:hypothetical protein
VGNFPFGKPKKLIFTPSPWFANGFWGANRTTTRISLTILANLVLANIYKECLNSV